MTSLYSRFQEVAARYPDQRAIVENGRVLSYKGLLAATRHLGGELRRHGVRRGSRVAVLIPNQAAFVCAFFAVTEVGGIVVPMNPSYKEGEIASIVRDGEVSVVLTCESLKRQAQSGAGLNAKVLVVEEPGSASGLTGNLLSNEGETPASRDDPVLCMYSSGSTGQPKRIVRTHFQLLYETERLISALGLSVADRVIGVAPFTHINGLMRSMVASMLSGATLFPLELFERRAVAQAIQEHKITVFIGVPFMFAVLAETRWPRPVNFSSLRHCISSSAPLKADVSRKFCERYGIFVLQLYGTTETGTIAINLGSQSETRLDSVGIALDGIRVDIFSESRQLFGPEEEGEIGIKSPAATKEYPGLPEQTRESFWSGYFFPGDIGRKDAEGNIYLAGRKSLFINRAGYKVNPYEIEELITEHPKVNEAAVIGVETPYGDQKIKAVVVAREPLDELEIIDFCRNRVADFKVPSIVEFRTELPKSPTGKILRKSL